MNDRSFRTIAYFVGTYAIALAALYLLGYWGSFQLNVLEFIGLGDVLSYALYPLLVAVIPVIVGAAWSQWSHDHQWPPGGGADTSIGQFGRRHWRGFLIANWLATLLIVYFAPEPGRWLLLEIPIMIFAVALTHVDYIIELVPDPQTRSVVLWFVLSIAAFVFYTGRLNAYSVRQGRAPLLVDVLASGLSLQSDEQHPVSYVGHVGDCFVLYESIGPRLVILKADKVGTLVLMKNPKIETAPVARPKLSPSPSALASPTEKVPE